MRTMIMPPLSSKVSRSWASRAQGAVNTVSSVLGSVQYPNALLAVIIIGPAIVMGFAFGSTTVAPRAAIAEAVADVAAAAGLGVQQITIDGLRDTREGDVLDYLAVTPQTSLLGFNIESARERVLALPWVKEASVRRVYPDALFVEIEEHAPFARMLQRERVHLVTLEGEEITDEITGAHAALPLVVGEGAPGEAAAFFGQLAARQHVLESVIALERVGNRRWTLHMRDDVQVHLPEQGVDAALLQLEQMMRRYALLDRAIAVVDMRLDRRLVVRLTNDAAAAMDGESVSLAASRGGA